MLGLPKPVTLRNADGMTAVPNEDGLHLVEEDEVEFREDDPVEGPTDGELEELRDAFIDGFNARDLDALTAVVHPDVECPDIAGDGFDALAEELEAIWERSPAAILTRGYLDDEPCAMAWLPDEDGHWIRASLVCFDVTDGLIGLVCLPDDADSLERAVADEPTGDELDEWIDWAEWDRGEESTPS